MLNSLGNASSLSKGLLIFDMNGTLLHRLHPSDAAKKSLTIYSADFKSFTSRGYKIYIRPGLEDLMTYLARQQETPVKHSIKYDVAVWTSAMQVNALPLVLGALGPYLDPNTLVDLKIPSTHIDYSVIGSKAKLKLSFLWSQEQCSKSGEVSDNSEQEESTEDEEDSLERLSKGLCGISLSDTRPELQISTKEWKKDLRKVWQEFSEKYSQENTWIIDDTNEKILKRQRKCHLPIKVFSVYDKNSSTDQELFELIKTLESKSGLKDGLDGQIIDRSID